jgi:succinyl-CoA synthetase beta subunit
VARLHEYQGKELLAQRGLATPEGRAVSSADAAREAASSIGGRVVLKIQAWTTGRAAMGGVAFADTPEEAATHAGRLLGLSVGNFPVEQVLVEECLPIADELFVSVTIDDRHRQPMLLLGLTGGTGIEDRADAVRVLPIDVETGIEKSKLAEALSDSTVDESLHGQLASAIDAIVRTAREIEARSVEVNPLVTTTDGRVLAADCRMTIDDYAVFRHPELGIEIARELDHPPTELERIAYAIEQADHRGTFYFARLPVTGAPDEKVIGFHGAGGGGSMMSLDAVSGAGFTPANFTDTSGNPSSAKVYAAARIILSQAGLRGYFGSGSGVASQEQFHSAYGLAKAFNELALDVPALIRLGGNSEDRAVEILESACASLPAAVEGYRKDDPPRFIGERFAQLVEESGGKVWQPQDRIVPEFVGSDGAYSFAVRLGEDWEGRVWFDHANMTAEDAKMLVHHNERWLKLDDAGKPVLCVSEEDALKADSDMIAAEVEFLRIGRLCIFVDIPIEGLDELLAEMMSGEAA